MTTLILIGSWSLNHWLNKGDAHLRICSFVQSAIGAKCEIESFDSNMPRGISVKNLRLFLRDQAGGHEEAPSITLREMRARVSFLSLAYGTIKLKDALLIGLEIHALKRDGVLWTQPTLDFVSKTPSKAVEGSSEITGEKSEPFRMTTIHKIVSAVLAPVRIKIEEVGLKEVTAYYREVERNTEIQSAKIGPISAIGGLSAWMRSNHIWFQLSGSESDHKLMVKASKRGKELINRKFTFKSDVNIKDLNSFKWTTITRGLPEDLGIDVDLGMTEKYKKLEIKKISASAGDILNMHAFGSVDFIEGSTSDLEISLSSTGAVDLGKLSSYTKALGVEAGGRIEASKLEIKGHADLNSLSHLATATLPAVELEGGINDMWIKTADLHLQGLEARTKLEIAGTSSDGFKIKNQSKLNLENLQFTKKSPSKNASITVRDYMTAIQLAVINATNKDEIAVEKLEVDLSAKEVIARSNEFGSLNTDVNIRVSAFSKRFLHEVSARAFIDLGKLMTAGLELDCKQECQKIKIASDVIIPSIEKIVAFVRPVLGERAALIPTIKKGSFKNQIALTAILPPGELASFGQRVKKAEGSVNLILDIKNLNVQHESSKSVVKGIGLNVAVDGKIKDQSLSTKLLVASIENPALKKPLTNTQFSSHLMLEDLAKITLQKMALQVPSLGALIQAEGSAEISSDHKPENIAFSVATQVQPDKVEVGLLPIDMSGEIAAKIRIDSPDLNELLLGGEIKWTDFSAKVPDPSIDGKLLVEVLSLDGSVPFRQKLLLSDYRTLEPNNQPDVDSKTVPPPSKNLDQLIDQFLERNKPSEAFAANRMKIESYSEVRPNVKNAKSLTATKLSFKDLAITDIEIDVEVSQRMFSLNQMVFTFLGGKVKASAQAAFDTKLRQIRFVGQCTEIDTRKLADSFPKLKDKMTSFSLLGTSPYIDGTVRLAYDAVSGDMSGGLEVTRIGKDQLRAMLLYVDPEEANPTIAMMRKALNVGDVRQVSVPIKNGQIGVALDIRLLSAPIPTPKLQRFPLAQLVKNFTAKGTVPSNREETVK
jgi:hypothetical protein